MNFTETPVVTTAPTASKAAAVLASTAEPKAQETPAPEQTEKPLSPELGIIARKERALVQKQQEFLRQKQEWEKKLAEAEAKEKSWNEREQRWKENPEKALEEYGHSYQTLTERALNGGNLTPQEVEKRTLARIKEVEDRLENERKAAKEAQEARAKEEMARTVKEYKENMARFVESKADEYKLINLFDKNAELIYDTVEAHYENTCEKDAAGNVIKAGKVLSNEEAAGLVEKYFKKLVEDANSVLTPKQQAAAENALGLDEPKPQLKTLSNGLQQTSPSFLPAKTEEDRMKRALAALDGKK